MLHRVETFEGHLPPFLQLPPVRRLDLAVESSAEEGEWQDFMPGGGVAGYYHRFVGSASSGRQRRRGTSTDHGGISRGNIEGEGEKKFDRFKGCFVYSGILKGGSTADGDSNERPQEASVARTDTAKKVQLRNTPTGRTCRLCFVWIRPARPPFRFPPLPVRDRVPEPWPTA